jgi:hypothetical protein
MRFRVSSSHQIKTLAGQHVREHSPLSAGSRYLPTPDVADWPPVTAHHRLNESRHDDKCAARAVLADGDQTAWSSPAGAARIVLQKKCPMTSPQPQSCCVVT